MIKLQANSQILDNDETIKVERIGCIKYIDGKPIQSDKEQFCIKGNVQPLGGRDLLLVPEADRFKNQYWIFTGYTIKVNDRILRKGLSYQVQTVESWGSYFKARMMEVDVGPNATHLL